MSSQGAIIPDVDKQEHGDCTTGVQQRRWVHCPCYLLAATDDDADVISE